MDSTNLLKQMDINLSQTMINLFERRYLSDFDYNQWNIDDTDDESVAIVLKKVIEIGRIQERDEIRTVLPNILHSCHSDGHSLIMLLNGLGTHQEVFLGGKRMIGKAKTSTTGYINGVESAFRTYYGGLKMSEAVRFESLTNIQNFISYAPAMTVITGIPSNKESAKTFNIQSLDRLARAAGNYKYSMMAVAEPISALEVDKIVDKLRDLKGEIYTLKNKSITEQKGSTATDTTSRQDIDIDRQLKLQGLSSLAKALTFMSMLNPLFGAAGVGLSVVTGRKLAKIQAQATNISKQISTSNSISISYNQLNAHAEFCEKLIDEHLSRLLSAKSNGWWQLALYVAAENEDTLSGIVGAIKSIISGENSTLDPIRTLDIPNAIIKKNFLEGNIITVRPNGDGTKFEHPLGRSYDSFSTCVNSKELSTIIHLPINEIPGIRFINHAEFSQNPPKVKEGAANIFLGHIEKNGDKLLEVKLNLKSLNRHLFISGMTGGGKSNTCLQILYELYTKHSIPFIVIDPVKSDYAQLLSIPELKSKFNIFSVGISSDLPLRLNPFELLSWDVCKRNPKFLSKHIEYLKAIFTASLPDFNQGPAISIIEDSLVLVYKNKGWNINFSTNKWLLQSIEPTKEEWVAVMPTMDDYWIALQTIIDNKKYKEETQKDIREAILTRFSSLSAVNKGAIFNCSRSVDFNILFNQPCLVEIKDLADNDDKSMVMAILFAFLYEFAEYVRGDANELKHVTVIEEAHRLLSAPKSPVLSGNPHAKLVEMFSQMIAEMRGLGEGFIIADQSPQALSNSTIRNTNIKIIHQLTDETDRQICGGSINLSTEQKKYLNNLETGYAVVNDDTFEEPVLVKVNNFKDTRLGTWNQNDKWRNLQIMAENLKKMDSSFLFRKNACEGCKDPCKFYYDSDFEDSRINLKKEGNIISSLDYKYIQTFSECLIFGQVETAESNIKEWKLKTREETGLLFCKGIYYIEKWLDYWIEKQNHKLLTEIGGVNKDKLHVLFSKILFSFLGQDNSQIHELCSEIEHSFKKYFTAPQGVKSKCDDCKYKCLLIPLVKEIEKNTQKKGIMQSYISRDSLKDENIKLQKTEEFLKILPQHDEEFANQVISCSMALSR